MYISTIIARVLALTDYFLSAWVDVQVVPAGNYVSNCFSMGSVQANVNACGVEFLDSVIDIVEGLVYLTPSILAGLFANGAPEA
jgi:hypothetical protein